MTRNKQISNKTDAPTQQEEAYEFYAGLRELKLSAFIDCWVNKNRQALVKSGQAPNEALEIHWLKIYSQYCVLINSAGTKSLIAKSGRQEYTNAKILIVKSAVLLLQGLVDLQCISPVLLDILKTFSLGITYSQDKLIAGDWSNYSKQLDLVLIRLKRDESQVEAWKREVKDKGGKKFEVTEEYFGNTLAAISEFLGFHIKESDLTVFDFCIYVNQMRKASLKREVNRGRRN